MSRFWIGRAAGPARAWIEAAAQAGVAAEPLELIRTVERAPNEEERSWLQDLHAHAACLFVSARAVRRLRSCLDQPMWPDGLACGAVGPATAAALVEWMALPRWIARGGTAADLATEVAGALTASEGPVLLCGAVDGRPEPREVLASAGFTVRALGLYLTEAVEDGPTPSAEDRVLLFSPSGARSLKARLAGAPSPSIWALGPTTAAEVEALGLPVAHTLSERSPAALAGSLA